MSMAGIRARIDETTDLANKPLQLADPGCHGPQLSDRALADTRRRGTKGALRAGDLQGPGVLARVA